MLRDGGCAGTGDGGSDLVAERCVGGSIEAEQGFLQDGTRRFSEAQEFGEIFGEFLAVTERGIEADEFAEGGLVERIEHPGAVEHGAGGGGCTGEEELFREEQGIVGAEVGVAQERIEHELGT